MSEVIKVFVGCAPNHEDAESMAVLEYSIRKHTNREVSITWMKMSKDPESPFYADPESTTAWNTRQWATPFSGFRWALPYLCDFKGKAIYTDSDVIFMDDIAKLWDQKFEDGKIVMAKGKGASWRYCVSLWDCAEAKKLAMALPESRSLSQFHRFMTQKYVQNPQVVQQFEGNWNCLDGEDYDDLNDPEIKAIHYTSMPHQPQLAYAIPRLKREGRLHWFDGEPQVHWREDLRILFDDMLEEAKREGYTVPKYIQDEPFGPLIKKSVARADYSVPSWGQRYAARKGL